MAARFGRVITAMVTPFREDGSLDVDEAQRLARHLVDGGCDGLVVCGSTGESATLTHHEKVTLFRAVKDAVGSATVIAGSGTYDTAQSIELTREAEKAGADGVLAVTPYYNRPPQDGLLAHFEAIADASDLPVMLYDIPVRTGTKIAVETLLRAAEHPRIVALKEASGDLSSVARFLADKPADFEFYSGQDEWTLAYQALGVVGAVSVLGNVVAGRIREQFDAFDRGDVAGARAVHEALVPLMVAAFCAPNPIPIKAGAEMLGFRVGAPRSPLRPASAEEKDQIRRAMESIGAL